MTKFILTTALAAAMGLPSIAMAQTAPISSSIVCRPTRAGETANANVQNTALLCHPLNGDSPRYATGAARPNMAQRNTSPNQMSEPPPTKGIVPGQEYLPYPGYDGNPND
jgi:hypothetical protein